MSVEDETEPRIAARWNYGNVGYRLIVKFDTRSPRHILERLERDAANGERWVQSGEDRWTTRELALLAGVKELGERISALGDTMNYAKGQRHG